MSAHRLSCISITLSGVKKCLLQSIKLLKCTQSSVILTREFFLFPSPVSSTLAFAGADSWVRGEVLKFPNEKT
jgi:hypothetical protein